ncbi:hypothetical protein BV898_19553, partial [Hypsibius exemplaris]
PVKPEHQQLGSQCSAHRTFGVDLAPGSSDDHVGAHGARGTPVRSDENGAPGSYWSPEPRQTLDSLLLRRSLHAPTYPEPTHSVNATEPHAMLSERPADQLREYQPPRRPLPRITITNPSVLTLTQMSGHPLPLAGQDEDVFYRLRRAFFGPSLS